ncbi:juvenile hormone esterase [Halyomorpha halys]|uniref:juvenile hormone esterase n=1 Tax=Halyomorpha halys TaxID=286706 RepID=UPI0006D528C3|nr:venom carboxylesterase-6-like [Halyomorpha halys]
MLVYCRWTMGKLSYLLVILSTTAVFAHDPQVVQTAQGKLRGFKATSRSGRPFLSFASIPFAKPPVGPLRFQPPQEPEPWEGIRNATDLGPWCIQYNMYDIPPATFGVEDCLYLAVHTHNTRGRAPVMFHLHGGGFISGNGPHKTDPRYLMDEDVVIVDINYRLGIMGFLSFEDEVMPGNQGMKDQVMALRWVKKNIAKFGGDPNRVTLVGESAGAGSVYHHTVSPLSRGLFHGGIAESGSSYAMWCVTPPGLAKEYAQKLAGLVSCPKGNSKEAVACMMKKDAKELVGHMEDYRIWQIDPLILFLPVLEPAGPGAFITGPINKWQHNPVPLLMGTTSAEGLLRTGYFLYYNMDFKWYDDNFERLAPVSHMYFATASNPNEVTRKIREFYYGNKPISLNDWVNVTNTYTDSWFTHGIFEGADKHTGDVYFYYFDYRGEYSFFPAEGNTTQYAIGAAHTDEILYIWYNKNFASDLKGKDVELSKKLVKIWTDFAKHGKAIPPPNSGKWDKWVTKKHNYMHITNSGFKPQIGLHEDRYRFWSELNFRDKYPWN